MSKGDQNILFMIPLFFLGVWLVIVSCILLLDISLWWKIWAGLLTYAILAPIMGIVHSGYELCHTPLDPKQIK